MKKTTETPAQHCPSLRPAPAQPKILSRATPPEEENHTDTALEQLRRLHARGLRGRA